MIFDLERYVDEPLVYDDNKRKLDNQKIFMLGVKIRTDMIDLLLNGIKAEEVKVRKLDPSEDQSYGVINMVADQVLSGWGLEFIEPDEDAGDLPVAGEALKAEAAKVNQIQYGEARILRKTIMDFRTSDSNTGEERILSALQDDFDAISKQLNNELNVFPAPIREMIMMTILDRMHNWEKLNWE